MQSKITGWEDYEKNFSGKNLNSSAKNNNEKVEILPGNLQTLEIKGVTRFSEPSQVSAEGRRLKPQTSRSIIPIEI